MLGRPPRPHPCRSGFSASNHARPVTSELDVARIARLANLPLTEDEETALRAACAQLLDAFSLADVPDEETPGRPCPTFEDAPVPWPEEGIEAILAAFPKREGRLLET